MRKKCHISTGLPFLFGVFLLLSCSGEAPKDATKRPDAGPNAGNDRTASSTVTSSTAGADVTADSIRQGGDATSSDIEDLVVAKVGDVPIMLSRLLRVTRPKEKRLVLPPNVPLPEGIKKLRYSHLDQLVVQETLWQEANRKGIKVSDREVDNWMETTGKAMTPALLKEAYPELEGISDQDFREAIRKNLAVRKLQEDVYGKTPEPTEEETVAYFEENREKLKTPPRADAFVIMIMKEGKTADEARRKMQEVRDITAEEMDKAESVGEMRSIMARNAKLYSEHEPTRAGGGWWVIYEKDGLSDGKEDYSEFQKQTYDLPVQTLSPVLEMKHAFYITWVEARMESRMHEYSDVSETIRRMLYKQRVDAARDKFFQDLKDRYSITTFPENLMGKGSGQSQ